MKHYGDITKINGAEMPIVDIICGGSPCQDLSVAGKRAGLAGERSGLFMEQIRIIKEMRDHDRANRRADEHIRPRYMVWENVPGAFSSNSGEDFRAVLEETAKVAERDASIPGFEGGKWPNAGCIMGNGWSIAWRIHDAQFWGVPQRRKRIALVADFGGLTAPEILFERKSVPGDPEQGGKTEEGITSNAGYGVAQTGGAISFQERAGCPGGGKGILIQNEHTGALSTFQNQRVLAPGPGIEGEIAGTIDASYYKGCGMREGRERDVVVSMTTEQTPKVDENVFVYGISSFDSNAMRSANPNSGIYEAEMARTLDNNGGNPACNQGGIAVVYDASRRHNYEPMGEVSIPAYGLDRASFNQGKNAQFNFSVDKEKVGALVAKGPGGVFQAVVRRLTPLECERLQGYPDGWTDIGEWVDSKSKKHKDSDSPRYKALGNSIALPFWQWMARRMVRNLPGTPTMGSLFDGIGGFPLVFSRCNCIPVWASEIEEFPIAVTKRRFPDV